MNKNRRPIYNILFTVITLVVFFGISLWISEVLEVRSLIHAMFALAVFLISLYTNGYIYGIVASLLSVMALNYAFIFPYFKFNFSIPENLVSAIIMLIITIMSSTLTTKIRQQDMFRAEGEKEKMRANLLRAVSHDLRTPLTTIYGSSSAIVEKYDALSKEQIIQLADGIREDSQWLVGMVENLLTVTRIDNVKMKIVKSPVVLEELIDSVLIRFRKCYPNQEIEINIPDDFVMIPMDATLIEQVVVNILENAVQHAVGMTRLILKVYIFDNKAFFEIIDDGCGIDKERLDNIFTGYFEKKDAPADCHKSSMGIGLSVCASIIRAHEGSIMVENNPQGGCCFRFFLNLEDEGNEQ
ncbi:MAG: DUF4118 domain-containing protein [Lachnospiraceae bacterium]|nr:DUF4118 domain-containing protein [Lachnospiraceae bacterium]